ncbi:MAG: hypothetical protein LBP34_02055 [Flavobacteriaceae bacterium]|jgi:hypothetical protein|nr:hypothetical protein [Flavobacteriaceae bacterium]
MKKGITISLISVILLYIAFVFQFQHRIEKNNGLGWDGTYYNAIYENFMDDPSEIVSAKDINLNKKADITTYKELFKEGAPFNQRIGVPYIASLLKTDKFSAFTTINLVCFFIGLISLLYKWKVKNGIIALIFAFCLLLTPQMPFRLTLFYPMNVDGVLFLYLCWVICLYNRPLLILILTLSFLPFKEATILIGVIYFFSTIIYSLFFSGNSFSKEKKKYLWCVSSISVILAGYIFYRFLLIQYLDINFRDSGIDTILFWVNKNIFNYTFYIRLLACMFVVFSGYWIFYLKKIIEDKKITHKFVFIVCLFPFLIFSGTDVTRILCILLPVLLDEILDLNLFGKDYVWITSCFILFIPLKFPFLILDFKDNYEIGEGFFITQAEYLRLRYSLFYVAYSLTVLILLFSPIFKKHILNHDKIFRPTKNKSSISKRN